MDPVIFFLEPKTVAHKQYEALRMYYVDGNPAHEVAEHFGYTYVSTGLTPSYSNKFLLINCGSRYFS